jgi:hypothetical protein
MGSDAGVQDGRERGGGVGGDEKRAPFDSLRSLRARGLDGE